MASAKLLLQINLSGEGAKDRQAAAIRVGQGWQPDKTGWAIEKTVQQIAQHGRSPKVFITAAK